MRLLWQPAISGDYRCVIGKMVEVKCKLTGIELNNVLSVRSLRFSVALVCCV